MRRPVASITNLRLNRDERDFLTRRVRPFLDHGSVQTRSLSHLMQEAYLQGLRDAAETMRDE